MMKKYCTITCILVALLLTSCGQKKINRDYIPILKENLFKLQEAVKEQNLAQIDSLLSVKIIEKKQSSDSLIRYVYGPDNQFNFYQFGDAQITYTNEVARIDCYIMDSTSATDRPLVFYLEFDDGLWLFTSFKEGTDSVRED